MNKLPSKLPEAFPLDGNVKLDRLVKLLRSATENGGLNSSLTKFLLSTQIVESVILDEMLLFIATKLKIDNYKKLIENQNFKTKNIMLLSLSHDVELFNKLEDYRIRRNKLIHKISELKNPSIANKETKKILDIGVDIMEEFKDRLMGKKVIPVLSLYSQGWNDALDRAKELIRGSASH